jgi:hypothetical protein
MFLGLTRILITIAHTSESPDWIGTLDKVEPAELQLFVDVPRCGDPGVIAAGCKQSLASLKEVHIYSNEQNSI